MAPHQYLCPECGVALQSPQEVTGKSVRCLGCQAVFTARPAPTVSNVPPPPRKPEPPRRKPPAKRLEDDSYQPELPPLPRNRKVPAALWVVGGAMALAVGLTIFLFVRYRDRQPEGTTPVAARTEPPTKPIPQIPVAAAKPAAVVAAGRVEEEEETATVPGKGPPAKNRPPDLSDILPKLPGLGPPNDAGETRPKDPPPAKPSGPVASRPADPSESRPEAVDPPARGDGPIPIALLGKLKAATVFIKVSAGSVHGTGSGFLLQVNGNTALIVTNDHVAHPPAKLGPAGEPQYELVFHSGRKNEFSVKAELVAGDHDHDLALLRVSGVLGYTDFPAPLNTTDKAPLAETMPIYIFGFPFGEMLATSKANPAVTIGKGTISSLREDDVGEAAFIQIDGDVNPGNSGGPVVDARGRLVGVTVAKVRNTNIGLAIPPIELHRMLGGRVGNLEFRKAREAGGSVEVEIRGTLIDPMDRVNAASLLVARADEMKDKPAVGAGGKWPALPGAEKVDLKIAGRGVSGQVKLPVRDRDRGEIEFLFQTACVDKEGKTTYFPPVSRTLREGPEPAMPAGPGGPPNSGVGPPGAIPTPKFPTPPGYGPKSPGPGPGPLRPFGPPGPPGKAPGG